MVTQYASFQKFVRTQCDVGTSVTHVVAMASQEYGRIPKMEYSPADLAKAEILQGADNVRKL